MSLSASIRRIVAVTRKELIHLFRDKRMLPIVFVMPILQLIILGYAANFDVTNVPLVMVDYDHTAASRALSASLNASEAFNVVETTDSEAHAAALMDKGDAAVVVIAPQGLSRSLKRAEATTVPAWVDGTDTNRALLSQAYLSFILQRLGTEWMPPNPMAPKVGFPSPQARILYNPTMRTSWFMVPGVLVMVLTVMTSLLAAMAIVKERENGTIEQLSVTPIRPVELIIGKLAPFVLVGVIDGFLVAVAAVLVFGVPFRGSVLELSGMVFLYLVSTLAIGLLISTASSTQQQAMMSTIMAVLPSILLGGVVYPVSNMPDWAQYLANLLPIRYFIVMVRGVFLKGVGFSLLWREALVMTALGVVLLVIAVFRFRKRSA